jgi:hypothetical protein
MSRQGSDPPNESLPCQRALSRWNNQGGAGPCGPQMVPGGGRKQYYPGLERELSLARVREHGLAKAGFSLRDRGGFRERTFVGTRGSDGVAPKAALSETALGAISRFSDQRILGQLNNFGSKGYARC